MSKDISLKIKSLDITLTPGCLVRLGRFDATLWRVGYGWYSWGSNRKVCGWYLEKVGHRGDLKPLQEIDLEDIYFVEDPEYRPTKVLSISENGRYEVSEYDVAGVEVIDPAQNLNTNLEKLILGEVDPGYESTRSLYQNIEDIERLIPDIRNSIADRGVDISESTPVRDYSHKISEIAPHTDSDIIRYIISEGTLNAATVELEGDVVATIPDGVTTIGNKAFMNNAYITKVVMPDSVTTMEDSVFRYPGSSNNKLPFGNCVSLKEIVFSNNLNNIAVGAFIGCTSLTSITIPDGVTSIDSAFISCTSLTSITIPDSVTSIGNNTFNGCTSLTSITIPDSVTSIGEHAFSGCTSLTSITIPDSVTSIGGSAFSSCSGLTSITIPDSVTSIEHYAFDGCTGLTSITIPDSVTSIGDYAFYNCTSLTDIYYIGTQAQWEQITIGTDAIPAGVIIHYNS